MYDEYDMPIYEDVEPATDDVEADADVLASAGCSKDEDYGGYEDYEDYGDY